MTSYFLLDKILIPNPKLHTSVSLLFDKCTRVTCLKEESGRTNGEKQVCVLSFLGIGQDCSLPLSFFINHLSFFWLLQAACSIFVPQPGTELGPSAVRAPSPNPGTPGNSAPPPFFYDVKCREAC